MLTIWCFTDGKRGHENQTLGLVEALARLVECRIETVTVKTGWPYFFAWLAGGFATGKSLPKPDLITGAGHTTHWPMLAARQKFGGKIAVLMKPSLPLNWFDWVIAPEHDGLPPRINLITTTGPINRVRASATKSAHSGLMLIGGASKEYGWSEVALLRQIQLIALHHKEVEWQLTTSRRTPVNFLKNLTRLKLPNVTTFSHDQVSPDWLPAQLSNAAQVWVTPDSASMVYESLSSGADVGCFELPYAKPGRVAAGVEKLLRDKRVGSFADWQASGRLPVNPKPLNEAERCASELLKCLTKN